MRGDPRSDVVAAQYARWVYPEPIADLPAWLEHNWQWADPSHSHRLYWPDRAAVADLDILVAGCGANQAAILAYTNPDARVVGIDVSGASLDHHRRLRDRYGLRNLDLELLPIEEIGTLERDFDLIISTGVLHHLADPVAGLAALADCLRSDGVASLMVYARYGRIGVEMLQGVFRDLDLRQDEASVRLVEAALAALPGDHPVQSYRSLAPDLQFDAGVVDTFLHGRERTYTTDECIALVEATGLVFDDWLLKAPYAVPSSPPNPFFAAVARLPRERRWSIMERINVRNACHFFVACRPERPPTTYRIDFASTGFTDFVPALRYRCRLEGSTLHRHDWRVDLDPSQTALLRSVDGERTIGEVIEAAVAEGPLGALAPVDRERFARELFSSLWERDVLAVGLRPATGRVAGAG